MYRLILSFSFVFAVSANSMPRACVVVLGQFKNSILELTLSDEICTNTLHACRVDLTPAIDQEIRVRYTNQNPVLKDRYKMNPTLAVLGRPLEITVKRYEDAREDARTGFDPEQQIFRKLDDLYQQALQTQGKRGVFAEMLVDASNQFKLGVLNGTERNIDAVSDEGTKLSPALDWDGLVTQFDDFEVARVRNFTRYDHRGKIWLIATDVPGEVISPEEMAFAYQVFDNQMSHNLQQLPKELGRPLTEEEILGLGSQVLQIIKVSPDPKDPSRRIISDFNPSQMPVQK